MRGPGDISEKNEHPPSDLHRRPQCEVGARNDILQGTISTLTETAVASTVPAESRREKPPPLQHPPKTHAARVSQKINDVVSSQPQTPKDTMVLPWPYRFNNEVGATYDLLPLLSQKKSRRTFE